MSNVGLLELLILGTLFLGLIIAVIVFLIIFIKKSK